MSGKEIYTLFCARCHAAAQGVGNVLQLSTSIKVETPLDRTKGDPELRASLLSLLLSSDSQQGGFPGLELVAAKNLSRSEYAVSLIPHGYWGITARGHLAISLGVEFPVAGIQPFDGKIVALFLWDYVDGGLWW